jgi:hypothetical protein
LPDNTSTTTAHLPAARAALLRSAYLNADPLVGRLSHSVDVLLELLQAVDPDAAERAAADIRSVKPAYPYWQRAADLAPAFGLNTAQWDADRARLQPPQDIDAAPEGGTERAAVLFANITRHHPAVAAALIQHARDLPDTWCTDLFHADLPTEVPRTITATPPEAAPASTDFEDCAACMEAGDICRTHRGQDATARGYSALFELFATTPKAQELLARVADDGKEVLAGLPAVAAALTELQHDEETSGILWAMAGRLQDQQDRARQESMRRG